MRVTLLIASLFLIFFSSCRNTENELFTMEMEARLDIPAGLDNLQTHVFVLEDIPSTFLSLANQSGVSLEAITRVSPSLGRLEGVFSEVDYSRFDRVIINLTAVDDATDTREVFFQELINLNHSGPLNLFGSLPNLKEILQEDSYNLEVEIRFRTPTVVTLENRLTFSFVAFNDE